MRRSRSILSTAMQIRAVRRYCRPPPSHPLSADAPPPPSHPLASDAPPPPSHPLGPDAPPPPSHPLGPDAPPLSPLGPPRPPPFDLVMSGPLAPPRISHTPLKIVDMKNVLGIMDVDQSAVRRMADERSLIEQFEVVKPALRCRGMLSPYKRRDLESRFVNDAFLSMHSKKFIFHMTAIDLMASLVTMPTDFWRHCLDYLMSEGAVVYEEWDCEPTVCIRFVLCDQGAGFLNTEGIHYLRGESDASRDRSTKISNIAVTIYDEKELLLFEMAVGFKFEDSLEAEIYAMYLLMKRAMNMTDYFYGITDCDKVENVLRAGYLLSPQDRESKLPVLCHMRRYFKRFSSRRMPREGISLVDAVMKINVRYQAKELLDKWQGNLDGKPLFCIDGSCQRVNKQQVPLEIHEDVCYIIADGDEKLHIAKYIMQSFCVEEVRVVASNIEYVAKNLIEMLGTQGCKIIRTSSCSVDIDFGHGASPKKLCLVFDIDMQNESCSAVEGYKMTVLMIHPDEKSRTDLRNVPELSARSKACYKYGKPRKMPRIEKDYVAGKDMLIKGKKVLQEGSSKLSLSLSPRDGDIVKVNYSLLYNGKEVETSRHSSVSYQFTVGQGPFKALDLAVKTMKFKERSLFTIPADLAWSESSLPPNVPLNSELQLDVQVVGWNNIHDISGDGCLIKKVLKDGSGQHWEKPKGLDQVTVKYEAKLDNGTVVSKSYRVEFTVKEGYLCPAIGKAVEHMQKGERACLTVKPKYGFGEPGRRAAGEEGAIPESANLEIDLELISWKKVTEIGDPGSRILKRIQKNGEGHECPSEDADIRVKVTGRLEDGTIFMRKGYADNKPFVLNWDSGELFYGLKQAILKMKKGEVAFITLPPENAYGSIRSSQELAVIPPNSTLVYEVELVSFKRVQS